MLYLIYHVDVSTIKKRLLFIIWQMGLPRLIDNSPDSKVHGTNMGPIWGRQDPGGPHVSPWNFAIWVAAQLINFET